MATWSIEPAFACSCALRDPETRLENSEAAFIGRVISRVNPPQKQIMSSADPVTYVFAVEYVAKGNLANFVEVLSPFSGASCGFEDGIPEGKRSGILLRIDDYGNYQSGLCSTLEPGELASVSILTTPVPVPDDPPTAPADELNRDDSGSPASRWYLLAGSGLVLVVLFVGYRTAANRGNTPAH